MTPYLQEILREPNTGRYLELLDALYDNDHNIISGILVSDSGSRYPIVNGIPRFIKTDSTLAVKSFGDEWNFFNFINFKVNWLSHTVKNTFGSTDVFRGKTIIDAGGGSGAQSRWFSEYGAEHVILLELSHSVDDVVKRNLEGLKNVDIVQCSIDSPPFGIEAINGIVYCHNVIQHTPSVEETARALWKILGEGGELVFNCYGLNDSGFLRSVKFHLIYKNLRRMLCRMPFFVVLAYARVAALLRLIPFLGAFLERLGVVVHGDVPIIAGESILRRLVRRFRVASLNTFDLYGSHEFQHHKSNFDILRLALELQPDSTKIKNLDEYFAHPPKIGCALRIFK